MRIWSCQALAGVASAGWSGGAHPGDAQALVTRTSRRPQVRMMASAAAWLVAGSARLWGRIIAVPSWSEAAAPCPGRCGSRGRGGLLRRRGCGRWPSRCRRWSRSRARPGRSVRGPWRILLFIINDNHVSCIVEYYGPMAQEEPAIEPSLLASTGYLLARLGMESRRWWGQMLAEHGLTPHQFGVLMALAPLRTASQQQLSRALGVDPRNAVPI